MLTISPLLEMGSSNSAASSGGEARSSADDGSMATAGLAVAPIGLVNMLNAGGAVLAAELNGETVGPACRKGWLAGEPVCHEWPHKCCESARPCFVAHRLQ